MSVFRRRVLFRDNRETGLLGSLTLITATTVAASIAFAGTAAGNTSVTTADASGQITFAGAPITEIILEVSGTGSVVCAGTASGLRVSPGSGSGTLVLAGSARCDSIATGAVTFAGSATVGSVFTMDASGAVVVAGTATSPTRTESGSGTIVFSGTVAQPVISGGTVETAASGEITFGGSALGSAAGIISGAIEFAGIAEGTRTTSYITPKSRTYVVRWEKRR